MLKQWFPFFPTFDGLWPPFRVSQHQWPPVRLRNWLSQSMFPLIFCALCAQKFWRVRTFCGNSPRILCPKPKRFLCPKSSEDQKKQSSPKTDQFLCPRSGEDQKKRSSSQIESIFPKFSLKNTHKKRSSCQTEGIFFRIFFEGFPRIFVQIRDQIGIFSFKVPQPSA